MKYIGLVLAIFIHISCFGQKRNDLIGTWQIDKVENYTESGAAACQGFSNTKLTFHLDNTYTYDAGPGYITTGKWKMKRRKIKFYDSNLSDPSQGTVADHTYPFKINEDGVLIMDEYTCSELGGKTYYIKE